MRYFPFPGQFQCHFISNYILIKMNPAPQDSPPAAGRASDIFISAAVRSLRSIFILQGTESPVI